MRGVMDELTLGGPGRSGRCTRRVLDSNLHCISPLTRAARRTPSPRNVKCDTFDSNSDNAAFKSAGVGFFHDPPTRFPGKTSVCRGNAVRPSPVVRIS